MFGTEIRRYGERLGMATESGLVYGPYRGYMLTMQEGAKWRSVTFAVRFSTPEGRNAVATFLANQSVRKQYHIQKTCLESDQVLVIFSNAFDGMEKLQAFVNMFVGVLVENKAEGLSVCSHCGKPLSPEQAVTVRLGDTVMSMHQGCVIVRNRRVDIQQEQLRHQGSVLVGLAGALLGGLIGAIPWALAIAMGRYVIWFSLLIGLGAGLGYDWFHGRKTSVRTGITLLSSAVCVVLSQGAAQILPACQELMQDSEWLDRGYSALKTLSIVLQAVFTDSAMGSEFIAASLCGIGIAWVGLFVLGRYRAKKNHHTMEKVQILP
jgi:hypothetical protein